MAEIGEIVEVAVGKRAAHFHRREHRAEALAIAAGIADRHQAVGFFQNSRSVHSLLPALARARLLRQPLALEPFLDQGGDLGIVLVHHHHVRIALDAGLRQVDDIDAAAGGL